ncbi:hypothetical protein A3Q37_03979 [Streptomyces sp. PTY087I2]|nr:hypothetical protein A3Q37_03979 [Streptomyces sp. PTY087I2]
MLRVMDDDAVQRTVFDPALKQFPNAFRTTDPVFPSPAATRAWQRARATALAAVRDGVAASPWAEALVVRGSVLMALWFGEEAREPGDLDFVVAPASWRMEEERTSELLAGVAAPPRRGPRRALAECGSAPPGRCARTSGRTNGCLAAA